MGVGESKESIDINNKKIEDNNLQFIKEVSDIRYGQTKIFKYVKLDKQDKSNKKDMKNNSDHTNYLDELKYVALIQQRKQLGSEEEVAKIALESQDLERLDHDSVVKLLRFRSTKDYDYCTSYSKVCFFYEYISSDLQADIQIRQQEKVFYDESELWYIIISVISALGYLRQNNYEHGDINPSTILLNAQGKIKILPKRINLDPQYMNTYQSTLNGKTDNANQIQQNTYPPQHDWIKSDIFSLGLVILEAALLQKVEEIQDGSNICQIIPDRLVQWLEEISKMYSIELAYFIKHMLTLDEHERPDIDVFINMIQNIGNQGTQYADHIFSLVIYDNELTQQYGSGVKQNPSYNFYDVKNNPIQKSPVKNQTPINDYNSYVQSQNIQSSNIQPQNIQQFHTKSSNIYSINAQPFIAANHTSYRQEKVRRSKWTLDENTDNNTYVGSTASSTINLNSGTQSLAHKQYTQGETYSTIYNQYTPSLTSNQATTQQIKTYVPILIKDGSYSTKNTSTINQYSTNPISIHQQTELNNMTQINQIIAKYHNQYPQKV